MSDFQINEMGKKLVELNNRGAVVNKPLYQGADNLMIYATFNKRLSEIFGELKTLVSDISEIKKEIASIKETLNPAPINDEDDKSFDLLNELSALKDNIKAAIDIDIDE